MSADFVTVFAPAKLNLFLAVTGRREDGFHELVSVVAPLAFGDRLRVCPAPTAGADWLDCDEQELPTGPDNLVLAAAAAFRMRVRDAPFCHFILAKRIPLEAGLGGGSSDAVAALRALQHICGNPLEASEMAALAAELGSDCPLFLKDSPVIMRGRGESIAPLPTLAVERLRGRRVVVFKPAFGVPTGWAFRRMRGNPAIHYLPPATAERRLARAFHEEAELFPECLCFNSFEVPVFEKFVPLGVLARRLRARFELPLHLSGSGSACFLFPGQETSLGELQKIVQDCLGPTVFFIANRFS